MTILNTYQEQLPTVMIPILFTVLGVVLFALYMVDKKIQFLLVGVISLSLGVLSFINLELTETRYEVIVDNFSDIDLDKYEVIESRGEILTVRDKD